MRITSPSGQNQPPKPERYMDKAGAPAPTQGTLDDPTLPPCVTGCYGNRKVTPYGAQTIEIRGRHFHSKSEVSAIGGVPVIQVDVVSSDLILGTLAANQLPSGRYDVTVTGPNGSHTLERAYFVAEIPSTSASVTLSAVAGTGAVATITASGEQVELVSIEVLPADQTINAMETLQYTAIGHYSDNSTADITNQVTWESSDTSAATIDNNGLATGV